MNLHGILGATEELDALDPPGHAASQVVNRILGHGRVRRAVRGSWLGHPLHPLLVTVPLGAWTSSAVFDVVFSDVDAARRLVGVGLFAAPPTVLAGWADYAELDHRQQRVALVHAASNATGITFFALALRAYRRRHDRVARAWLLAGLTAVGVGGALGGHLSYAQGAGVFRWSGTSSAPRAEET